ncbi:MAG TPA: hypothetical protein VFC39_11970 [Acidobacteriaceae bacterium]|nr:hypothetical protein [Acidobacteriaceae bacterium]
MKNTMIRAFVIALALTGAVSTAHSKTTVLGVSATTAAFPVPMCPWNDPNACGVPGK